MTYRAMRCPCGDSMLPLLVGHRTDHRLAAEPRGEVLDVRCRANLLREVQCTAVPRPEIAEDRRTRRHRAQRAELHPLRLVTEVRDGVAGVLSAGNLPCRTIFRGEVAHRKVDGDGRNGQLSSRDTARRIMQLGPDVVGVEALVFDRARHSDVAATADQDVVGRSEDRGQDRRGHGQVDQVDPFIDVQHVARRGAAAERVAMGKATGPATGGARRVDGEHLSERQLGGLAHALQLCWPECITNDDVPISVEQRCGLLHLVRREDLEPFDAVFTPQPVSQPDDVRIIEGSRPPRARRISADEVVVLGGGLDLGRRGVEPQRVAVARGQRRRAVGEAVRWYRGMPTEAGRSCRGISQWICPVCRGAPCIARLEPMGFG